MGQLLWTCGKGSELQSDIAGFRLVAGRAPAGGGYRYAVMTLGGNGSSGVPIASGSRESLREAIEAAESAIGAANTTLAMAS